MKVVIRRHEEQPSEVSSSTPPILAFRFAIRAEGLSLGQTANILDTRMFIQVQADHQQVDLGQTELDVTENGSAPRNPDSEQTLKVLVRVAPESAKWIAKNVKAETVDVAVSGSALCLIEPEHALRWEPLRSDAGEAQYRFRIPSSAVRPSLGPRTRRVRRPRPSLDPFAVLREAGMQGLRQRLESEGVEMLRAVVRSYVLDPSRRSHKWSDKDRLVDLIVSRVTGESERGKVFLP